MRLPALAFSLLAAVALLAGPTRAPAAGASRIVLIDAGGRRALELVQNGDTLRIATPQGEPALVGELHGPGKRHYRVEGAAAVAEVKLKGDSPGQAEAGFKLRTPDGRLLWKVKITGEKIKISADEEGTHPFVLSLKQTEKVKVVDGDERPLGVVRYRTGKRVTVEDAAGKERYAADTEQRSALFGVLLLDTIPMRERQILMAELLAAGY